MRRMHVVEYGPRAAVRNCLHVIPVDLVFGCERPAAQMTLEILDLLREGCPIAGTSPIGGQFAEARTVTVDAALPRRAASFGAVVGSIVCRVACFAERAAAVRGGRAAVKEPTP